MEVRAKRAESEERNEAKAARQRRTAIFNQIFELEAQPPTTRIGARIAELGSTPDPQWTLIDPKLTLN